MILIMKKTATAGQVSGLKERINSLGYFANYGNNGGRTIISFTGNIESVNSIDHEYRCCIEKVINNRDPYILTSREVQIDSTIININSVQIGGDKITIIAGPCAVESYEQCLEAARIAKQCGASLFRGGAFKPRTSPYSFQGMGLEGLKILAKVREEVGLPIVTEVLSTEDVDMVSQYADIIQVGARNMQNSSLLKKLGNINNPVLLKRGLMSTIKEFLMSAEYILSNGNSNVILCERGIRTFETSTRNTPDLAAIPVLKQLTHLPVIFDPSHSTGKRELVSPMSAAAIACGADGLIVEIHPYPLQALCDGEQSLTSDLFAAMMQKIGQVVLAVDKAI